MQDICGITTIWLHTWRQRYGETYRSPDLSTANRGASQSPRGQTGGQKGEAEVTDTERLESTSGVHASTLHDVESETTAAIRSAVE